MSLASRNSSSCCCRVNGGLIKFCYFPLQKLKIAVLGFKAHAPKRLKRTQKLNKSRIVHQMVHFGSDSTLQDRFTIFL
jgi:hypothetical protein